MLGKANYSAKRRGLRKIIIAGYRVRDNLETRELITRQATIYTVSRVHRPFVHICEAVPIEELRVFQNVLD
jgi:hypothetical protein